MTNEKDRESNPSEYAPVSKEYSNALIARDIWKAYNEADYETAYKIVSLVKSEAVEAERERWEDASIGLIKAVEKVFFAWDVGGCGPLHPESCYVQPIRQAVSKLKDILSPDQGTDDKEANRV